MKHIALFTCSFLLLLFTNSCETSNKNTESTLPSDTVKKDARLIHKEPGKYAFDYNGIYLEIDANRAARVSAFRWDEVNFFTDESVNKDNWGTSLWTSPQSAWGWPPSRQIDVLPYKVERMDSLSVEFTSQKDSLLGYVVKKKYNFNTADTSVWITYTIVNASDKKQKVAPWEISRVAPGGLTL
ncbi:MAG: hypothetical protein NZ529_09600, partial [Cytophagaceae bacterium]|nr:hypothetical protein [Cytophagaceae bacterium]MDW8457040.1 hypothetical protein [Cytophagaceae bacterium]